MDKRRVLFIVPRCASAGPLFVVRDILRHCDRNEFDMRLISLADEIPARCIRDQFEALLPCDHVPLSTAQGLLGWTKPLKTAIDRFDPHVIHTTGAVADVAVSRLYPHKQLTVIHSDFRANYTQVFGRMPGLALAWLQMRAVRRARVAVTVSESLSQIYARDYGFQIPFIRNGVEVGPLWTGDREALRRQLGLPQGRTIFVCAATFSALKNQGFLAECFAQGPAQGPLLLLLGDGETWAGLRETYGNAQNVRMPGRVNNVREYLRAADYYVSASRSEGAPLSVLEAMAEGLPLLLSDIPQHREIVSLAEESGELYKTDDPASFVQAMGRVMEKDRASAAQASRTAVEQHFSARTMSIAYQRLYQSI